MYDQMSLVTGDLLLCVPMVQQILEILELLLSVGLIIVVCFSVDYQLSSTCYTYSQISQVFVM